MVSIETHNNLMRWIASAVISLAFWTGVELLATEFSWRHVVGGTLITTLFLYAISAKAEADKAKGEDEED